MWLIVDRNKDEIINENNPIRIQVKPYEYLREMEANKNFNSQSCLQKYSFSVRQHKRVLTFDTQATTFYLDKYL